MGALQRIAGGRRGRWLWLGLALLVVLGLGGTFVLAGGGRDQATRDAAAQAKRYAETVLFENLNPKLVEEQILGPKYRQGELLGPKYRELLIAVQDAILVDPYVNRVRIWDQTGLLVFSTDRQDEIGATKTADKEMLKDAIDGKTTSAVQGGDLLTVTPLRIPGQLNVNAVAGIEQDADAIAAGATSSWSTLRLALFAVLAFALAMVAIAVAFPEPPPRAERVKEARVEVERVTEPDPAVAAENERLRRELETTRLALQDLENELQAERELAAVAPAGPTPVVDSAEAWLTSDLQDALARLHRAEEQVAMATDRADAAEARIHDAEERARVAEERARDLENFFPSLDVPAGDRSGDAPSEEQVRQYELTLRNAAVRQLRGPVSRLRGATIALKEEISTSKGRDLLERLDTASSRLDQLVADLESLGGLVDGSLPLRLWSTEVERLVERVVTVWKRETEREVILDAQPVAVPVDQNRLQQILETLLEDANERTDPAEPLHVKVRPHAEGALIAVEAPGELPQRADLQLAIARRLIELHGGRIWYEPRPDGTAILVMFPSEGPVVPAGPVSYGEPSEPAEPAAG